jgi:hypothetical protein
VLSVLDYARCAEALSIHRASDEKLPLHRHLAQRALCAVHGAREDAKKPLSASGESGGISPLLSAALVFNACHSLWFSAPAPRWNLHCVVNLFISDGEMVEDEDVCVVILVSRDCPSLPLTCSRKQPTLWGCSLKFPNCQLSLGSCEWQDCARLYSDPLKFEPDPSIWMPSISTSTNIYCKKKRKFAKWSVRLWAWLPIWIQVKIFPLHHFLCISANVIEWYWD